MSVKLGDAIKNKKVIFKDWLRSFSPEVFEVSFSDVIRGRGPKIYLDPDEFFAATHMTTRMKDVLKWCLARTAGLSQKSVIHLSTGFGGGKSHLLTLLYHTFKHRKAPDAQLLRELGMGEVPEVDLVAADGHDLAYSIASQGPLSRYVRETKEEAIKALESAGRPVVILLDEFVVYLAKLGEEGRGRASQELAHLHTLIEAVKSTDRCAIVVTSPSGSVAYGKESERLDSVIRESRKSEEASKLTGVLDRVTEPIVPVESEDFISILKKRLVDHVDEYTARNVEQYMERLVKGASFSGCYPFHPLLRDVLYNRVSLYPGFQKTRDSLKIAALAVKGVLNCQEDSEVYVISPSEVPLSDPDARAILTNDKVFGENLEQAVTKDVVGHAREMDGRKAYGPYTRMATAVFMYSLHPDRQKRGALPEDVLACMVPEVKSRDDAEARLKKLQEESDHMWYEGGRYLFKPKENVPNMIRRKANSLTSAEILEHVKRVVYATVFQPSGGCEFFSDLSYFSPSANKVNVFAAMPWEDVEKVAAAVLSLHSERKNTLVVLVPAKEMAGSLYFYVKMALGAEKVKKEVKGSKDVYNEATVWKDKYEADAVQTMRMMYTRMRYLRGTRVEEVPIDPSRGNTIADAVMEELRRKQKLADPVNVDSTNYIKELMGVRDAARVRDLFDDAEKLTTIPFAFREDLLKILSEGVSAGIVGAVEGEFFGDLRYVRCHFMEGYQVREVDTILSRSKAVEVMEKLKEISGKGEEEEQEGKGTEAGTGAAGGGAGTTAGGTDFGVQPSMEVLTADIKDLSSMFGSKIAELMIQRVEYELEVEFQGTITGRVTAKTPEERLAVQGLIDALSKASILLPSAKAIVKIRKKGGGS